MKYRLTALTPLLVGDGSKLSPIDYMVWKDHVNVLDQARIFRLLAKGPRLENYLKQLTKAEKLDFASWGGFAQNFAKRRTPFEHASYTAYWQKLPPQDLFIPTFATGPAGPYIPGSALRGAVRTGVVFTRGIDQALRDIAAKSTDDRPMRQPGRFAEEQVLGDSGHDQLKTVSLADSSPISESSFKVYMIRVSTLEKKLPGGKFELRWKQSPRGSVEARRAEDSTPQFAEMAGPGTTFEGSWTEREFLRQPEVVRALHWKEPLNLERILEAVNNYASAQLAVHLEYAATGGLEVLEQNLAALEGKLAAARQTGNSCVLALGWASAFFSKVAALDTSTEYYRQILRRTVLYSKVVRPGVPFPKTRRIVFLENRPATLAGWAQLEII
jgi:CRISPR-associated protein Csm5